MTSTSNSYPHIGDATPSNPAEQKSKFSGKFFRSFLFDRNDYRLFPITQKLSNIKVLDIKKYNIATIINAESSEELREKFAAIQKPLTGQDKNKQYIIIGRLLLAKLKHDLFPLPQDINQDLITTTGAELNSIINLFNNTAVINTKDKMVIGLLMTAALNEVVKNEIDKPRPQLDKLMAQYEVAMALSKLQWH